jgi:anti-sigma factor RsiW
MTTEEGSSRCAISIEEAQCSISSRGVNCTDFRPWIFRSMDDELSAPEQEHLNAHLLECASCSREMKILLLPRRLAKALATFQPSSFFYQRLRRCIGMPRKPRGEGSQIVLHMK